MSERDHMIERIQKIIASAGVTSRRAAEDLIAEGRVRVNGQVVTELGTKADADKDHIKVDGKLINPQQPKVYVMLNKPVGYVTTMSDPEGRRTVQDLLKGIKVRVYPVGRLDYNTEGMLILTNDGDFAHLITHPKHEFPKTYLAKVKGFLEDSQIGSLEQGIYLDDGKTAPAKLKKVRKEEANSWIEITIHEGRKRQVRRMFDRVGHSVIKLKRIRTGGLVLGSLPEGAFRYLTPAEVSGLMEMAQRTGDMGQGAKSKGHVARVRAQGVSSNVSGDKNKATGAIRHTHGGEQGRTIRSNARVVARSPKPAHRGGHEDARPWRARKTREEKQRPRTAGRTGRVGARTMQDTRDGLRRNQAVRASAAPQKRSFDGPRVAAAGAVRRDSAYSPASRPSTSRPATRTGTTRLATGAFSGKPEFRKKPAPRSWPDGKGGSSRRTGFGNEGRGSRPASGPRPNNSSRPAGRGPINRNRPAGSRGPGQGGGKRGR